MQTYYIPLTSILRLMFDLNKVGNKIEVNYIANDSEQKHGSSILYFKSWKANQ